MSWVVIAWPWDWEKRVVLFRGAEGPAKSILRSIQKAAAVKAPKPLDQFYGWASVCLPEGSVAL